MGITTAVLRVRQHRKAARYADVEFLIDSGAVYSVVPGRILDELDIEPYREMSFCLADGTGLKRKLSSAYFEFEGEGNPAPVVYGDEGDYPSLGATRLGSIGLVLKPFTSTLHPMRLLMAGLKSRKKDILLQFAKRGCAVENRKMGIL